MEMETSLALTCLYFSSLCFHLSYSSPSRPRTIGIHPLDFKYYDGALIKCKDGSKSFSRDRLNDNFCDCPDGTDEPGTSACPAGKFYCRNAGSTPRFLFSSHVNDNICDCCDGSDEYAGKVICPNTCVMGGNIVYQTVNHDVGASNLGSVNSRKTNPWTHIEDSAQKLGGLKVLVFLQLALAIIIVALRVSCKRKARRKKYTLNKFVTGVLL